MMCHRTRQVSGRPVLPVLLTTWALLLSAVGSTFEADTNIAAAWLEGDVAVDGSVADWSRLERIDDGPALAVRNDHTTLYLVVASSDVTVREQLARGLNVWLDAAGRHGETFGLRLEGLIRRSLPGETPNPGAGNPFGRTVDLNALEQFDLLGPAKLQRRLIDNPAEFGIAMAVGVEDGTIVYELKLPLRKTEGTPHAVGAEPGATLSIGLETPADPQLARSRNRLDDPMNTNPWITNPYGYGRYFNPPPPPEPGASRQPKEVVIKPMKLKWAQVRLATAPTVVPGGR